MKLRAAKSSVSPVTMALRRRMLFLPLALAGCAEPYVVGGQSGDTRPPSASQRVATLDVEGDVELIQGGRRVRGRDGDALNRGDEVRTFAGSYALLTFADGDRVWLDYDTRVRVGSIFTFFGRVFASVSGIFQVDSEFVAASSEGTEFTVTVGRAGRNIFSVAVRSGIVGCAPRRGRWAPLRLASGNRLHGAADGAPSVDRMGPSELQEEFGWVGRVAREPVVPRRPYTPPTSPQPAPRAPQAPATPAPQAPATPAPQAPATPQAPTTQPRAPSTLPPLTRPPRTAPVIQPSEPVLR